MRECVSFTYQFNAIETAEQAAEIIKEWVENNIENHDWINNLFPVENTFIFVGNDTPVTWIDYDNKLNRLADVLNNKMPGVKFSGEQEFCNMSTGYTLTERFECNGKAVIYNMVLKCVFCASNIDPKKNYKLDGIIFCDKECAKNYIIEQLMEIDDELDEDELYDMSVKKLNKLWEEYD